MNPIRSIFWHLSSSEKKKAQDLKQLVEESLPSYLACSFSFSKPHYSAPVLNGTIKQTGIANVLKKPKVKLWIPTGQYCHLVTSSRKSYKMDPLPKVSFASRDTQGLAVKISHLVTEVYHKHCQVRPMDEKLKAELKQDRGY